MRCKLMACLKTLSRVLVKCRFLLLVVLAFCLVKHVSLNHRRLFNEHSWYQGTAYSPHLPLVLGSGGHEKPSCVLHRTDLDGVLEVNLNVSDIKSIEAKHRDVQLGGRWQPSTCSSHKVALVVPYRARPKQLLVFLSHMHTFLKRQKLEYGIYVVEPEAALLFNRALLLNIGFAESLKYKAWQCHALHDVDLYPLDDRNVYSCPQQGPRHLTAAIDKYSYRLPYPTNFGGGCIFSKDQFMKINGFSNKYFGWGGEDDDLYERVKHKNLTILRYPWYIATYQAYKHEHESGNAINTHRLSLMKNATERQGRDGINSLKYRVLKHEKRSLYTWILVRYNQTEILLDD